MFLLGAVNSNLDGDQRKKKNVEGVIVKIVGSMLLNSVKSGRINRRFLFLHLFSMCVYVKIKRFCFELNVFSNIDFPVTHIVIHLLLFSEMIPRQLFSRLGIFVKN